MLPAGPVGSPSPAAGGRRVDLDILRTIAIAGVVAIHVFGGIVANPALRGEARWWIATAVDIGSIWVVPVFVMISGALLLDPRMHERGPADFYRRRLLRLGPAFVFWQVFYVVVIRMLVSGQELSIGQIVGLVADGTTYTHLYFLWLIAGLYLIAPVLASFLHGGGRRRAVWFAAVVLAFTVAAGIISSVSGAAGFPRPIVLTAFTQWIPYVGYFLAGWALRDVMLRGGRLALVTGGTVILLAEVVVQYALSTALPVLQGLAPVSYYGPVVALVSIGVFVACRGLLGPVRFGPRAAHAIRVGSEAAFGVYLVHFALLVIAVEVVPGLRAAVSTSLSTVIALYLAVLVIAFAISVLARRVPYLRRLF